MSKNLRHELRTAVFAAFNERLDKHSLKSAGDGASKVFSYSQRAALLDLVNNFSSYMKSAAPEVRAPEEVTKEHVIGFLESKRSDGATSATLDTYRSYFAKIGRLVGCDYSAPMIKGAPKSSERGAGHAMPVETADKLTEYAFAHPSGSALAFLLGRETGGRVDDVRRITYDRTRGTFHMIGKGGKAYPEDRVASPDLVYALDHEYSSRIEADGRIQLPLPGSIATWLRRTEDKLGLDRFSFHDMRRLCAQEHYDALRRYGADINTACRSTSVWLNHGPDRDSYLLRESYIRIW